MELDTQRLHLRELRSDDFDALHAILSDSETMAHYPAPFSEEKTRRWIEWNLENYRAYGFGLWAVELKDTGEFIGDCGITLQNIHGQQLPEVGYHIRKDRQRKGYASEAAAACIRVGFEHFHFPALYSYMKYTNVASYRTAMKNGMTFVEEYANPVDTCTRVYRITREEWEQRR